MKRRPHLAFVLLLLPVFSANAQLEHGKARNWGMNEKKLSRVDRVIEEAIADHTIPGAVLSVVRGNRIVYLKAYGNKSVSPVVERMTTETMFDLASVSKCVGTTLSFMQLIENGSVLLRDPVERYIPGFMPWTDPVTGEKKEITVQQLLTHSSGLSPYIDVNSFISEYGEAASDSLVRFIATEVNRNFKPGTDFMYSCLNFVILQEILQRVTGERLCDYARKHVFDVLGLKHTTYFPLDGSPASPEAAKLAVLCAPTEVQADGQPLLAQVHDPIARRINSGNSGNAGVFSNAEDLSVIAAAIMHAGAVYDKNCKTNNHYRRILSPMTVRLMTSVSPADAPSVGRAHGWDKKSPYSGPVGDLFDPETTICHTGYTGTSIVIDLKSDTAIILLTHRVHPEDKGSIGRLRSQVSNIVAGSLVGWEAWKKF